MKVSELFEGKSVGDHLVDLIKEKLASGRTVFWKNQKMVVKDVRKDPKFSDTYLVDVEVNSQYGRGHSNLTAPNTYPITRHSFEKLSVSRWGVDWGVSEA
jgi:hypothetical protein